MVTAASAAAQKLGYSALKAKQMDVVMGIVSERDVFNSNYGMWEKSVLWSPALHLRRGTFHILYHKFAVSRRYSQDTTEIQYPLPHMYNYVHIPPTTVMQ